MNNRIRELAEQAGELATRRDPASNIMLSVNQDLFVQKLGELILAEVFDKIKRTGILNDCEFESDMIADAVKEHFGVE